MRNPYKSYTFLPHAEDSQGHPSRCRMGLQPALASHHWRRGLATSCMFLDMCLVIHEGVEPWTWANFTSIHKPLLSFSPPHGLGDECMAPKHRGFCFQITIPPFLGAAGGLPQATSSTNLRPAFPWNRDCERERDCEWWLLPLVCHTHPWPRGYYLTLPEKVHEERSESTSLSTYLTYLRSVPGSLQLANTYSLLAHHISTGWILTPPTQTAVTTWASAVRTRTLVPISYKYKRLHTAYRIPTAKLRCELRIPTHLSCRTVWATRIPAPPRDPWTRGEANSEQDAG
jgi:hypothetical protein